MRRGTTAPWLTRCTAPTTRAKGASRATSSADRSPQTENRDSGMHLHRGSARASRARRHPTSRQTLTKTHTGITRSDVVPASCPATRRFPLTILATSAASARDASPVACGGETSPGFHPRCSHASAGVRVPRSADDRRRRGLGRTLGRVGCAGGIERSQRHRWPREKRVLCAWRGALRCIRGDTVVASCAAVCLAS